MKQSLIEALDCISELIVRLNDGEQYTDILERLNAVTSALQTAKADRKASKTSSERKRNPDKYYYQGIDVLDKLPGERPQVCEFVVSKGYNEILHFELDNNLAWVCIKQDGAWKRVSRMDFPSNKMYARTVLKRMAQKEEAKPGTFADQYIPEDMAKVEPSPLTAAPAEVAKVDAKKSRKSK